MTNLIITRPHPTRQIYSLQLENLIYPRSKPEGYDWHHARKYHLKLKNRRDDYIDPASDSHPYAPVSVPCKQTILRNLKTHIYKNYFSAQLIIIRVKK